MTHAIEMFGWFVFHVAIPLLAPLALLPLARLPEFSRSRSGGIVRRSLIVSFLSAFATSVAHATLFVELP
ncbi:hypothetical protein [Cupriavidus agavae]|uniref:Uncharacterized protein n=1 Tax=Cupriavidus agavae TaxID=1001822 RepID=A0A4Q7S779_9BURK|nr:hypothetical protein [Cupriavidus agavae]RZT42254.1 hypothetical protein EV147_1277 [Cupriavidus agavae]